MNRKPFVIKPVDRKAALDVLGMQVTVLASAEDTKDNRITVQTGREGTGAPPHSHDWDECFFVIGGEVRFTCGGETTNCTSGTFVHVPAGTVHSFNYGPNGGEMIEITGQKSNSIEMFSALDAISADPRDDANVVSVLAGHGVKLHV